MIVALSKAVPGHFGPIRDLPYHKDLKAEYKAAARHCVEISERILDKIVRDEFPGIVCDDATLISEFLIPGLGVRTAIRMTVGEEVFMLALPDFDPNGTVEDFLLYYEGEHEPSSEVVQMLMGNVQIVFQAEISGLRMRELAL